MQENNVGVFYPTPLLSVLKEREHTAKDVFDIFTKDTDDSNTEENMGDDQYDQNTISSSSSSLSNSSISPLIPSQFTHSTLKPLLGFIVVEPNYRVYAFTSSLLHCTLVSLSAEMLYMLPTCSSSPSLVRAIIVPLRYPWMRSECGLSGRALPSSRTQATQRFSS